MEITEDIERRGIINAVRPTRRSRKTLLDRLTAGEGLCSAYCILRLLTLAIFLTTVTIANADESRKFLINIPSQDVETALSKLATQSGAMLLFPYEPVQPVDSNPVVGEFTVAEALKILLEGSPLTGGFTEGGVITILHLPSAKVPVEPKGERMTTRKNQGILAVLGSVVATSGALAQDIQAKDPSAFEIDEVVVTAQRREQSAKEVPMTIVAIGADEIQTARLFNLADLSIAVPGLNILDSGTYQRRIYMRGVANLAGSSPLVGVYLDDVSVATVPGTQLDLRTYDLERVEVLKGPQGTLYGQGSVGGTIRFITKSPDLDALNGSLNASMSSTKDGSSSQRIQAALNLPVVEDVLAVRIAGTFENIGGWIDQPITTSGLKDINDQNVVNVRARGVWQPTVKLTIAGMFVTHDNDAGAAPIGEEADQTYRHGLGRSTTPSGFDDYTIQSLTFEYAFDSANFKSVTSSSDARRITDEQAINNENLQLDIIQYATNFEEIFGQEIQLSSSEQSRWQWTVGAFYQDQESQFFTNLEIGLPGEPKLFDAAISEDKNNKSLAVYGDTSVELGERTEIGFGVRYFEDDRTSSNNGESQSDKFDSVSPRVYAKFDIGRNANMYASISEGFRSGGFNFLGAPVYAPETTTTYELGSKLFLRDGAIDLDVALFFSTMDGFQVVGDVPGNVVLNIIANAGVAEIRGVDVAMFWDVADALTVGLEGNYVDTKIVELNATNTAFNVGDPLEFVPDYQVSLSANYDYDLGSIPGYVRIDYTQRAKTRRINRTFALFNESDEIELLNMNFGWQLSDKVNLSLFARNLLNDRGYLDPTSLEGSAARSRPRTVGFDLGVVF